MKLEMGLKRNAEPLETGPEWEPGFPAEYMVFPTVGTGISSNVMGTFAGQPVRAAGEVKKEQSKFKVGDIVRMVEGEATLPTQPFHGEAVFQGDSMDVPGDFVVLELLEDIQEGMGQNGWWNFPKDELFLLELVERPAKVEKVNFEVVEPDWEDVEGNLEN